MDPGRSMGKAFRPSRFSTDSEPSEKAESSLERDTRIRAYARRVQLRQPLFDRSSVAPGAGGGKGGG